MKTLLLLLLLLIPVPQQPVPSSVFHSSVPVETVDVPPLTDNYPFDNEFRIFVVDGEVVPYPENFNIVFQVDKLDEQRLIIDHSPAQYQSELVVFDVINQTFSPFKNSCVTPFSDYFSTMDLPANAWTISTVDDNWYLCNQITGVKSAPLPENYLWLFEGSAGELPEVMTSPSGSYVAFKGQYQSQGILTNEFFSYSTESSEILSLGTFDTYSNVFLSRWVEPLITIIHSDSSTTGFTEVYIADATQANSIEFAIEASPNSPTYLDNPPRYVNSFDSLESPSVCGKSVYDIQTRTLKEYDLDGLCRPEYGDVETVGYYRDIPFGQSPGPGGYDCCDIPPAEVAEVPVVRYDSRTGERKELYRGEVEQIEWVSPDDRYAILLIDRSGRIDFFPYTYFQFYRPLESPMRVLVDLHTGKILTATFPFEFTEYYWQGAYWMPEWFNQSPIIPMSDREVIVIDCNDEACGSGLNAGAWRLALSGGSFEPIELINFGATPLLTPDKKGIYMWSNPKRYPVPTKQGINIYNLETGNIIPLTQEFDIEQYRFELVNTQDSTIVTLYGLKNSSDGKGPFTVKIKADGSPYVELQRPAEAAIGEYVCFLRVENGLNIRAEANADSERAGTAEAGQRFLAAGQVNGWWQLAQGGFVSAELVDPSRACDQPLETPQITPEAVEPVTTPDALKRCELTVLIGGNLRAGPGTDYEKTGSTVEGQTMAADGQFANTQDFFTWWRLETGEWVREDFVREGETCVSLPVVEVP